MQYGDIDYKNENLVITISKDKRYSAQMAT